MAGLVRGISVRQILPRRSRTKHPENPVENLAGIAPGTASAIAAPGKAWDQGLQQLPLLVREVHASYDPRPRSLCPYL